MKRFVQTTIATTGLLILGAAAAEAATTGTWSLNVPGATSSGTYNFKFLRSGSQYDTRLTGNLKSSNSNNFHFEAHNDGYGFTQIARRTSAGTTNFDVRLYSGDVYVSSSVTLRLCHERTLWDDCSTTVKTR